MTNSLLPAWLGWAWVLALAVVAAVHVRHLVRLPDVTRFWHLGHIVMALGMIAMFWPTGLLLEPPSGLVGRTVFSLAALAVVVWAVVDRARRGRWTLVWPLLAVDMAVMVWMFVTMAPLEGASAMSAGPPAVNAVLGSWFALETLGWASGRLVRTSEHDLHLELPVAEGDERVPSLSDAGPGSRGVQDGPTAAQPSSAPEHARATSAAPAGERSPHAWHGLSLRLTLTVMSASMAWMLLAMAFGGPMEMSGMTGMDGM